MKIKKIGLLLNSINCNKFLYETTKDLHNDPNIDLIILINHGHANSLKSEAKKNLAKFTESLLFNIAISAEKSLLSLISKEVKEYNKGCNKGYKINDISKNIVHLTPIHSKNHTRINYSEKDKKKLLDLKLDIIINELPQDTHNNILSVVKDGIISLQYRGNRWTSGQPPAFWEVYSRQPYTGFFIQRQTGTRIKKKLFCGATLRPVARSQKILFSSKMKAIRA